MSAFSFTALTLIVTLPVVVAFVVPRRARLTVWSIVVMAAVVPWWRWTDHAHWDRIEWLPFSSIYRPRDAVLNVLFYVPIGFFFVRGRPGRPHPVLWACAFGLALSALTEFTQVFSHGRFPGATDVLTNTTGACLGAWLAVVRQRLSTTRT